MPAKRKQLHRIFHQARTGGITRLRDVFRARVVVLHRLENALVVEPGGLERLGLPVAKVGVGVADQTVAQPV